MKIFVTILLLLSTSLFAEVLRWEDCVKYAKANNQDLLISQEKINQSQTDVLIKKKDLSPKLNFSMSATQRDSETSDNSSLNLSKTIFDNKTNYYGLKSLEETVCSNKFDYENTSAILRFNLRQTFVNLFYAQEYLTLEEKINQTRKNDYKLVKIKYESGLENKGSVLTSEAQLLESEYEIKKSLLNIEKIQNNLKALMGNINYSSFTVESSFNLAENPDASPAFELIVDSSPVIQKLEAQKRSSEFNFRLEYLKISPTLSVSAALDQNISDNDLTNSVGLNLNIPIYQGNLRKEKVKKAKSAVDAASLAIAGNKNNILNNLMQTWIELQKSTYDVKVSEKALEAAEKRAEITRAKYSIGLVSFDDWTIIENNLISAKKNYLSSRINTLLKEADWVKAKGGTLDVDEK